MNRTEADLQASGLKQATFAGGCFWCIEPAFENIDGIRSVTSGYMGGTGDEPTYNDYAEKGHVEVVHIVYDPQKIDYRKLLSIFWHNIDPTDAFGQFVDRGPQYRSAVFYHDEEQKEAAEISKAELQRSGKFKKPVVTEILPASRFHSAEEYHQKYHKTHTFQYKFYRTNSGRDQFIQRTWKNE
jgi:peptide methionine sulfoxide reductase msrA/msrB